MATTSELAAMVYGSSGRDLGGAQVAEPRSTPLRCFGGDISTVVKSPVWGAWTFSAYAVHHVKQCRVANAVVIEHKTGNQWYVFSEGSAGYPPTHNVRDGSVTIHGVPRNVAKDLISGLV